MEHLENQLANNSSGTITLLFTDIEGSTNLLDRLNNQYEELLEGHHAIVRRSLSRWNGREVNTEGDAFFAVFPKAVDSINAVVDIQRNLNAQTWPAGVQVKVRMGLHTGEPRLIDQDYIGMDVHRAARIAHAGHGGQVLLSETTTALVQDELPDGISITNLGRHKLKDMRRPETIYQLVIAGLPSVFPLLKTSNSLQTNLPEQLTTFVGRDEELTEIRQLIANHRMLTLIGPGGTGKTRLSMQVASNLIGSFPQGVWFIELEEIDSPNYLIPVVASTLQLAIDTHSSDLDPQQQLLDYLSRQSLFMVFDNFEHLVDGAPLLSDFLKASPESKCLVTSRERLNLREEWVYPLHGLGYPQNGNGSSAEKYSGLDLFAERARQVDPNFTLTKENIAAVSRVCRLVDGLPLGIELAAAWVNVLTCTEIAAEIERDIDFLANQMDDDSSKHHSLRVIFNQSWQHLTPDQQTGFQRLGVFRGGFTREAAQQIASVSLALLSQFIQKSLLRKDKNGRFELHPLLKVFAKEKLEGNPQEWAAVHERHSHFYAQFLVDRARLVQGEKMLQVREEIRGELGNILAALNYAITQWAIEEAYTPLCSFAIYSMTEGFHTTQTYYLDLEQQLRLAGASLELGAPKLKLLLNVIAIQAVCGVTIGEPESEKLAQDCLALSRELNLETEIGLALLILGIWSEYRSEYREAASFLEEALPYLEKQNDTLMTSDCMAWLGWAYYELGDLDQAWKHFHNNYELCLAKGNIIGLAYAMSKLGTWADARQDYARGAAYHKDALKYFEAIGDQAGQGYALSRVSLSAWGMHDYEQALIFGQEGFNQFEAAGHRWGMATTLSRIGFAELALRQYDRAEEDFYDGLTRALDYKYPSTANYALVGLAALWSKRGNLNKAAELLILVLQSRQTPYLYKIIGRQVLDEIEEKLSADEFAEIQEEARGKELQEVIDAIRRNRLPDPPTLTLL